MARRRGPGSCSRFEPERVTEGGSVLMLHVGLDLSRTRLNVLVMDQTGTSLAVPTAASDVGGLASLAGWVGEFGQPVTAVIESMNRMRFIHDQRELPGWTVEIPEAVKVRA